MPGLIAPDITRPPEKQTKPNGKLDWLKQAAKKTGIGVKKPNVEKTKQEDSQKLARVRKALGGLLPKQAVSPAAPQEPPNISKDEIPTAPEPDISLPTVETQLDAESELAKIAKIRKILGLEEQKAPEELEVEKRAAVDKFYQDKLNQTLQNGGGYIDKVKSNSYEYEFDVKDTLLDKAKRAGAVKLLEARKVTNPDQLLTTLASKTLLSDYSQILSPTIISNVELLASELSIDQINAAFKRLNDLGFPGYQIHNLSGNRSFYEGLIKIGKVDEQTYQKICQELNPCYFLSENPKLINNYNDPKERKQVSQTFLTMASIFKQGGLTPEQKEKLGLAQKIALLDHGEPLVKIPDGKFDSSNPTIDRILNNPISNQMLESIIRISENQIYPNVQIGYTEAAVERSFVENLYHLGEGGHLPLIEDLIAKGFDIQYNVRKSGEASGRTEEDKRRNIWELQNADALSRDPIKLEWFKLINQIVNPERPFSTSAIFEYQNVYAERSELGNVVDFYASLNRLPQELQIPFEYIVNFRSNDLPLQGFNDQTFQSYKFDIDEGYELMENINKYLKNSPKGTPSYEYAYFSFIEANALDRGFYRRPRFNKNILPLIPFLVANIDHIDKYVKAGEPTTELIQGILSGNIELSIEDQNDFLSSLKRIGNLYQGVSRLRESITPDFVDTLNLSPIEKKFLNLLLSRNSDNTNALTFSLIDRFQRATKEGSPEKVIQYLEVMSLINESPSQEIQRLKSELIDQIVATEEPVKSYQQIEAVFIKNNLPTIGKVFKVFEILHPEVQKSSRLLSPVLDQTRFEFGDYNRRFDIIFRDLLKAHIFSGNRSLYEYLTFLKEGASIFDPIDSGQEISERERQEAYYALQKFKTIKVNSLFGRQESPEDSQRETVDLKTDIQWLKTSLRVKDSQTIVSRAEQMFLKPVGFQNIDQVLATMASVRQRTNERSLSYIKNGRKDGENIYLDLEEGDLVKGVLHQYLENIMQNGSVACEFLGGSASDDVNTPFGTDVTKVTKEDSQGGFTKALKPSVFQRTDIYGQLGLVFKDRGQFQKTVKGEKANYDLTKYELYHTGPMDDARHEDIRTGIASSEIDFMIAKDTLLSNSKDMETIYFTIAKQGFYIPITDTTGKVIFTPEMYQEYRKTFNGIEAYDGNPLPVKSLTETDPGFTEVKQLIENIKIDKEITNELSEKVRTVIKEVLNKQGIKLQDEFDTSILGARLYDTGSTGRDTNTPGDYDFDLMLVLDNFDFAKSQDIRKALMRKLEPQKDDSHDEASGYVQIRAKGATTVLPGNPLDIDIGINRKSDLLPFATHDAIMEKLKWIRVNLGEDAYYSTVANIVLAKQLLKQGHAYKKVEDGGFGGIGTENWILANNGNIVNAFQSFWDTAHKDGKEVPFEEFRKEYKLLDAGMDMKSNTHDNFIYIMKEAGYHSLLQVAANFLRK